MPRWTLGAKLALLFGAAWFVGDDSELGKIVKLAGPLAELPSQDTGEKSSGRLPVTPETPEQSAAPNEPPPVEAPTEPSTVETISLHGPVSFPVASYYPEVTAGRRTWQGIAFELTKTAVMATRDAELVINIGRSKVERVYLLQCARGDFARNARLGFVEFVFSSGDPARVELVAGRNTNYQNKTTDEPAGPDGFHVLDWLNPDPERRLVSMNVKLSGNARIHVLAATMKLTVDATRSDAPQANEASRKNVLQTESKPERERAIRTAFVPVSLNASPTRIAQKSEVKFAVHRVPVEATNTQPQRGLRLATRGIAKIHILHCGRRNLNANQQVGYYEMTYNDGTRERLYLVTERNINYPDWSRPGSRLTLGDPAGLVITTWENPHPDKVLQSIDLISSNSVTIQLWAMTVEKNVEDARSTRSGTTAVRTPGANNGR